MMCTSRSVGTAWSILIRNLRYSVERCRRWMAPITLPEAMSRAANRLVIQVQADHVADLLPFYRLIVLTAVARHAVLGLVPRLFDALVGYVSHDIGERVPCRSA